MDEVLLLLLKNNAHLEPIRISTTRIAEICQMSQQNASKKIILFQKEGIVQRIESGIKITQKGYDAAKEEYLELKKIFERGSIKISGKIVDGIGQGKYYMSLEHYKKNIREKFGFEPYPGTLNLKIRKRDVLKRESIMKQNLISIPGFATKNRSFGELFCYPAKINNLNCAIVFPLRTHHGKDVIEIVAKENLRKKLKGKKIIVEVN
ncbi:MAG: DUF120 domain-containing protein [Candidatus Micrarchaeia archaeon]|jgi:riboflavin kinase